MNATRPSSEEEKQQYDPLPISTEEGVGEVGVCSHDLASADRNSICA